MDIEVIYATEFGSSSTTMKIYKLASWIKRYNFKILSIEEQQQSYSEEEVKEQLNLILAMKNSLLDTFTNDEGFITDEWFEQFKKK